MTEHFIFFGEIILAFIHQRAYNMLLLLQYLNIFQFSKMQKLQKKEDLHSFCNQSKEEIRRGRGRREKAGGPSIFIAKTFEILEDSKNQDIICWNEDGTHFTIVDVDRFQEEILPAYFRHKNFSSFVRQLNMYDFHKIRNQHNKNIFQHREFRRNASYLLKNIRRKGCSTNKKNSDYIEDQSQERESVNYHQYQHEDKLQTLRPTLSVIDNNSQNHIAKDCNESYYKLQVLEDFIASLPAIESQQTVKQIIKEMKRDSKYRILSSKDDVRNVVHRIRKNKMKKDQEDGLQELSIEEEIMVENVDDRQRRDPSLAILSSDNYLPQKTQQLICSLMLCEQKN